MLLDIKKAFDSLSWNFLHQVLEAFSLPDSPRALLADDLLLSLRAKQVTFNAVLQTLQEFAAISNLHVNASKSILFPIGKNTRFTEHVNVLPFRWSTEPFIPYLGIEAPGKIVMPSYPPRAPFNNCTPHFSSAMTSPTTYRVGF